MKKIQNTTITLLFLMLLAPLARAEDAQAVEPYEAWFVLKLGGQRAGYMHASLKQDGDQLINTTQMNLAIKRGEVEVKIEQASRFVESLDYKPIRSESSMKLALMSTQQIVDFSGDQWVITAKNAGQETQTKIDPPKIDWLTPARVAAHLKQAIEDDKTEITVTTLDPSMGVKPVSITMKRGKTEDIEVFGKTIPATKWITTTTATPGIEIEQWTDAAGQPVKQSIPLMPGMEVEMLLADKALALADFDAPEMLASSLITPDKKIKNPRTLKRGVFEISSPDLKKNIGDTVPTTDYQTTKWVDDETLQIEIKIEPKGFDRFNNARAVRDKAYLASTSTLNHEDPAVTALVDKAMADAPPFRNPVSLASEYTAVAEHVRQYIRDYIDEKDLSVGFATASEVARTKKGDCTEHACLLAAVLRGARMPARTVTGLVYADQFVGHKGIFGFHMWTQVWIDGNGGGYWLDLDAAMPGKVNAFDATHIALSTSAMSDGEGFNEMVTMLPMMQGMKIKVVDLEWAEE